MVARRTPDPEAKGSSPFQGDSFCSLIQQLFYRSLDMFLFIQEMFGKYFWNMFDTLLYNLADAKIKIS